MFFKIILFSISLWQHFSFSSVQDTKTLENNGQHEAVSSFYDNIAHMKRTFTLKISYFKPNPFNKELKIPEEKRNFIKNYMPRFYSLETNFKHIDCIIQKISSNNPEIKKSYEEIQSIDWTNLDITYEKLHANIKKLISFYEKYKTEISKDVASFTPTENKTPPIQTNLIPEKPSTQSDFDKKDTKRNQKTFFTQISQLKLYVDSYMGLFFKKAILYFRHIIELFYR